MPLMIGVDIDGCLYAKHQISLAVQKQGRATQLNNNSSSNGDNLFNVENVPITFHQLIKFCKTVL